MRTVGDRSHLCGSARSEADDVGDQLHVPLPDSVAFELAEHLHKYPATGADLVFNGREHKPLNRNYFNHGIWHRAFETASVEQSQVDHPLLVHRTGPRAALASSDEPVDPAGVELGQRTQERLGGWA